MVKPGWENLFFMGLAQPLPTLVNLAEQQSKFVAAVISDHYKLPTKNKMEERIIADEKNISAIITTANVIQYRLISINMCAT